VPRDSEIPLDSGKIISMIGVRRSAKTLLLTADLEENVMANAGMIRIMSLWKWLVAIS